METKPAAQALPLRCHCSRAARHSTLTPPPRPPAPPTHTNPSPTHPQPPKNRTASLAWQPATHPPWPAARPPPPSAPRRPRRPRAGGCQRSHPNTPTPAVQRPSPACDPSWPCAGPATAAAAAAGHPPPHPTPFLQSTSLACAPSWLSALAKNTGSTPGGGACRYHPDALWARRPPPWLRPARPQVVCLVTQSRFQSLNSRRIRRTHAAPHKPPAAGGWVGAGGRAGGGPRRNPRRSPAAAWQRSPPGGWRLETS